jgi:hypothetical protein
VTDPATEVSVAAAVRRLQLVEELHRRGFQRLRILPYLAPSGLFWRLEIRAADCDELSRWSTSDLAEAPTAEAFLTAHPQLAEAGRGTDPAYAAWLARVVALARQGWLAYFFADWETDGVEGVSLLGPAADRPVLEEPPGGR